jgi:murein DD-endopeptidase MepM/ murein hydrolase activator NlpD
MTPTEDADRAEGDAVPWLFPLKSCTGLPARPHPGAFAARRRHDTHTGVDLYCREGEPVLAVEDGVVVNIEPFTGPSAGSPWWNDTQAVLVEGASGVVGYGEIVPSPGLAVGRRVLRGEPVGRVAVVLKEGKERQDVPGHSRAMLHVELYRHGTRRAVVWGLDEGRPEGLLDPTPLLLRAEGGPAKVLSMGQDAGDTDQGEAPS